MFSNSKKTAVFSTTKITISLALLLTAQLLWNLYALSTANTSTANFRQIDLPLTSLYYKVLYYDEVLTMTTKIAALNGNYRLNRRYLAIANELDRTLSEIHRIAPNTLQIQSAAQVHSANEMLVNMELEAFKLLKLGQIDKARSVIFSDEYDQYKKIYAEGNEALGDNIKIETAKNADSIDRMVLLGLVLAIAFYSVALIMLFASMRL